MSWLEAYPYRMEVEGYLDGPDGPAGLENLEDVQVAAHATVTGPATGELDGAQNVAAVGGQKGALGEDQAVLSVRQTVPCHPDGVAPGQRHDPEAIPTNDLPAPTKQTVEGVRHPDDSVPFSDNE